MDNWITELIRQVPSAAAVIGTVYLFLRFIEKREERQATNARDKSIEDRAHLMDLQQLWAGTVKNIIEQQDKTAEKTTAMIVDQLVDIDERYKKQNITEDLIEAIKDLKTIVVKK